MKKIFVTKSYLPPMEEYVEKISKIWDNHFLTNSGPLCLEFTEKLKKYLGVENLERNELLYLLYAKYDNDTGALVNELDKLDKN